MKLYLFSFFLAAAANPLVIQTSSGIVHGAVNESYPAVRHWLGVPFAQTPFGSLRFEPPQALPANASSQHIQAQAFGPNCPQYEATAPSIYNKIRREYFINGDNGDACLTVSIWAPAQPVNTSLPVLLWVYGGGDTTGGSSVPYQNPQAWVSRTQAHLVVSLQYRVNFFGSPNSPAQDGWLALADVRAATEWVRDNIAVFGGDPDRMVLWGQSAGAGLAGSYSLAYRAEPIVKGFIQDSGAAYGVFSNYTDSQHANFTFLAEHFGCTDAANASACLGTVPQADIESLIQYWVDAGNEPALSFQYQFNNVTTFHNSTLAYLDGHYADLPKILAHNLMDGSSLAALPDIPPYITPPTPAAEEAKTLYVRCQVVGEAKTRQSLGLTSYRMMYSGNFSNISPLPWMGAYHSSELPMIMGTYADVGGEGTPFQHATSRVMQDYYLAFAYDPENGVERMGWPKYNGTLLMEFGRSDGEGEYPARVIPAAPIEDACIGWEGNLW
ncbi:hypothetical protein ASPZODRAFT_70435 [Penicilliopsis zonata CBS 506.65]|uniref:Carboxylic ester hydrolase n=1 Tax=Penicilliopsis zonata CBS 506.65 TaxID=1073090 RepID=A0A1L9SD73_9EURO|nr:hypothetical protein ASPZODRAFT_70435 [Penicilliopsis zonata CBS 506.65]OJJ45119.1 hypothetical protein ASPZODRAFT_70435 [Penicilliopsis zonata CBS 506.65]